MASRALMARLSTAFSTSLGSARVGHSRGASSVPSAIVSPSVRRSSSAMPSTCSLRSSTTGSSRLRRANVSSRLVSRAPISAALLARASRSLLLGIGELHLQQLVVAGDDGEQVVEVVGDAAGELPDRLHALRLAQRLVLHDLLADVAVEQHEADEQPLLVAQHRDDDLGGELLAGLAVEANDERLGVALVSSCRRALSARTRWYSSALA